MVEGQDPWWSHLEGGQVSWCSGSYGAVAAQVPLHHYLLVHCLRGAEEEAGLMRGARQASPQNWQGICWSLEMGGVLWGGAGCGLGTAAWAFLCWKKLRGGREPWHGGRQVEGQSRRASYLWRGKRREKTMSMTAPEGRNPHGGDDWGGGVLLSEWRDNVRDHLHQHSETLLDT